MDVVFMGPPGAGKGTQAELSRTRHGVPHISTGDILRQAVREGTDVGQRAAEYMRRGDLVPDHVVDQIVRERLGRPDCRAGFTLDGFPRTLDQARALDAWLARARRPLSAVVLFEIRDEVLLHRLAGRRVCPQCGRTYHRDHQPPQISDRCDVDGETLVQRKDDAPDTILHRCQVFRREAGPMIEHYRSNGLLLRVDAERPVAETSDRIWAFVHSRSLAPVLRMPAIRTGRIAMT